MNRKFGDDDSMSGANPGRGIWECGRPRGQGLYCTSWQDSYWSDIDSSPYTWCLQRFCTFLQSSLSLDCVRLVSNRHLCHDESITPTRARVTTNVLFAFLRVFFILLTVIQSLLSLLRACLVGNREWGREN